jgi:hypothetical protein
METVERKLRLCQICLTTGPIQTGVKPIFTDDENLALMLFEVAGVMVIDTKGCPAVICNPCKKDLMFANNVRKKCVKASEYFKTQISKNFFSLNWKPVKDDEFMYENAPKTREILTDSKENQDLCDTGMEELDKTEAELIEKRLNKKRGKQKNFLEKKVECDICNKMFTSYSNLKAHIQNTHVTIPKSQIFHCRQCGKMSKNRGIHITHLQKHLERK